MKTYHIRIGLRTKKNAFNEQINFVINCEQSEESVKYHYNLRYQGFSVIVEEVKTVDITCDEYDSLPF